MTPLPGRALRRAGLAAAGLVGALAAFTRVAVSGDSMRPTLEPGDRLLVLRAAHRRRLRPGDLVTVRDPRPGQGLTLVKRVVELGGGSVELLGDNPASSTDSRTFGRVPLAEVTGKVLYRYGPPGRAGVVPRAGSGAVEDTLGG